MRRFVSVLAIMISLLFFGSGIAWAHLPQEAGRGGVPIGDRIVIGLTFIASLASAILAAAANARCKRIEQTIEKTREVEQAQAGLQDR